MNQTIPSLLQHCSFNQLKQIHGLLLTSSLSQNPLLYSIFLRRSTEFGNMDHSQLAFLHSPSPEHVLLYNAMIRGYARNGSFDMTLYLFDKMLHRNISPNYYTYTCVVHSCARIGLFSTGRSIHCRVVKMGCEASVRDALFDFYIKVDGALVDARKVFDEMDSKPVDQWNKMMTEYVGVGDIRTARNLFDVMPERDVVSWNVMLSGYAKTMEICNVKELFREMPEKDVVSCTMMVGILSKSGNLQAARELFEQMAERNTVSWNCMLTSYVKNERFKEAIDLFLRMHFEGVPMDSYTFVAVLSACTHLGELQMGKWVHLNLVRDVVDSTVILGTALTEMYANCGDIDRAFTIFIKMDRKDIFCWNVMMKALASHGRVSCAMKLFGAVKKKGIKLNEYTFMSMLFACSHGGLVEEGRQIFKEMSNKFNIQPKIQHYGCFVDLLCRNGELEEARRVVMEMPIKSDVVIWGALLGGCRIRNDIELAKKVIEKIADSETDESGVYVLVSNMYADSSNYDQALEARQKMEQKNIPKTTGISNILESCGVTC